MNASEFLADFPLLFSLYRIHHNQIVVNQVLVPVIDSLREHAKAQVHALRVSISYYWVFCFDIGRFRKYVLCIKL